MLHASIKFFDHKTGASPGHPRFLDCWNERQIRSLNAPPKIVGMSIWKTSCGLAMKWPSISGTQSKAKMGSQASSVLFNPTSCILYHWHGPERPFFSKACMCCSISCRKRWASQQEYENPQPYFSCPKARPGKLPILFNPFPSFTERCHICLPECGIIGKDKAVKWVDLPELISI